MKKMNVIHLLPEFTKDMSFEERDARFMENWELAASVDFIPDSLETLRAIDYTELKMLMNQNDNFFNAAVELCSDLIEDLIRVEKEVAMELLEDGDIDEEEYETIQAVVTLDDLLKSGYYCGDYENAKGEFITILLEDHLYKEPSKKSNCKTKKNKQKVKTIEYNVDKDVFKALLIVAKYRDELSADMSLGDLLDWLDKKIKTTDSLF